VNRDKRVAYGKEHQTKSIKEFWSHIFFTDEAHIDPTASAKAGFFASKTLVMIRKIYKKKANYLAISYTLQLGSTSTVKQRS